MAELDIMNMPIFNRIVLVYISLLFLYPKIKKTGLLNPNLFIFFSHYTYNI